GGDLEIGADVFTGNCAACHAGGANSVEPLKTLNKEDVTKYLDGGLSIEAITSQVRNGKGAMPAWSDRLDDEEIDGVVAYVFKNINEGW
uniref:Cytochrome c6 n=1 Tax=Bryopsis maxima TaxID=3129 RepID=CYC6_BRYMA|nr:RecName: Full=Cytochrome c6; AltName: Full=Cytochrome c-553; AltName: Full=Cytochrome c553; AltName: Full=Soluble cytochrome f [Bryopsis maxima]prf//1313302A cytochrome c6 [Bryopsis maxima]